MHIKNILYSKFKLVDEGGGMWLNHPLKEIYWINSIVEFNFQMAKTRTDFSNNGILVLNL